MRSNIAFPALAIGGGTLAFLLRLLQNRTGFEAATGLPIPGNLWATLLLVLLGLIAVAVLLLLRRLPTPGKDAPGLIRAFSSSSTVSITCLVAGLFLLGISGLLQSASGAGLLPGPFVLTASGPARRVLSSGRLDLLEGLLSLLCAVSLFPTVAACHRSGDRADSRSRAPIHFNESLLLVPVVILIVRLVLCYREHSVNPSLSAYYIPLLAVVLTTLAFYRLAAFAFQSGSSRHFLLYTVLAVTLCMASLADSQPLYDALFFAGGALTLTGYLLPHTTQLPS